MPRDPLAHFAAEFHHPVDAAGRKAVYLCGHSLGLQPKSAASYVSEDLAEWQRLGVLGHHQGTPQARVLGSVITSTPRAGLAALAGACRDRGGRDEFAHRQSAPDDGEFFQAGRARATAYSSRNRRSPPIVMRSLRSSTFTGSMPRASHRGRRHGRASTRCAPKTSSKFCERDGPRLALVLWPGVQYSHRPAVRSGCHHGRGARRRRRGRSRPRARDRQRAAAALHDWNADFAVWCSYKYLNAGPGAIGGCFVHERHAQRRDLPRFAGWWGHDKARRFEMGPDFHPIPGAEGWQVSNPPVLSAAPLLASLELFGRAGIARLREKSVPLTAFMQRSIQSASAELQSRSSRRSTRRSAAAS